MAVPIGSRYRHRSQTSTTSATGINRCRTGASRGLAFSGIVLGSILAPVMRTLLAPLLVSTLLGCPGGEVGVGAMYTLVGTVRAPGGAGVDGVEVELVSDTLDRSGATSSADGTYRITLWSRTPLARATARDPSNRYREATLSVYFDVPSRTLDFTLSP